MAVGADKAGKRSKLAVLLRTTSRLASVGVLASLAINPALADGGRGGYSVPPGTVNLGGDGGTGTDPAGKPGESTGFYNYGGSGGGGAMNISTGAGAAGGQGGQGTGGPGTVGAGGSGSAPGEIRTADHTNNIAVDGGDGGDGGDGTPASGAGAGGGGAGAAGILFQTQTLQNMGSYTGGRGGNGGVGADGSSGGGGGEGGAGVLLSNGTLINSGSVTGGDGGHGGLSVDNSPIRNGGGGDGGHGVYVTVGGTITNTGTITGGNGGLGGGIGGAGPHGSGGSAIYGRDISIINSGLLIGGLNGDGTGANAITFTGGTNRLELQCTACITGVVDAFGSDSTLVLGGETAETLDLGDIGDTSQFRGFSSFIVNGDDGWTLTGSSDQVTNWLIELGSGITLAAGAQLNGDVLLNAGAVTFFDGEYAGDISGIGDVRKEGPDTLRMTGNWSNSRGTEVQDGTLVVDGTIERTGDGTAILGLDDTRIEIGATGTVRTDNSGTPDSYATAIAMERRGTIEIAAGGRVETLGDFSTALDTREGTILVGGTVETFGADSRGISDEDNGATVEIRSTGSLTTHGSDSDAVFLNSDEHLVTVAAGGQIVTHGDRSSGINLDGDESEIDIAGSIHTSGAFNAHGVLIDGDDNNLRLSGSITTMGRSEGINTDGDENFVHVLAGGSITTADGNAIWMQGTNAHVEIDGDIHAGGDGNSGIRFSDDMSGTNLYSEAIVSGTIRTGDALAGTGQYSHGIEAEGNFVYVTLEAGGLIETVGDNAHGILIEGDNSEIDLSGTIRTHGANSYGLRLVGGNADISVTGTGVVDGAVAGLHLQGDNNRINIQGEVRSQLAGVLSSGLNTEIDVSGAVIHDGPDTGAGMAVYGDNVLVSLSGSVTTTGVAGIAISANNGRLELQPGFSISAPVGMKAAALTLGSDITLTLGGAGTDSFDISQIGAADGYVNFAAFDKRGSSTWTLTGSNTAVDWTALDGILLVNGSAGGMDVRSGAALGGSGSVGDTVIAAGGRLLGTQGLTLSLGSLALDAGSIIDVSLGTPGTTALFDVTGDLTLDGTLNVTDAGGFGPGLYRLFDYGGILTDLGLDIGAVPGGADAADLTVQTAVVGQINLVNGILPDDLLFWDGDAVGNAANGVVDGGDGIWSVTNPNWTNAAGTENGAMAPRPGFAVFSGTAGTVSVDDPTGQISVTGMQFAADGYVLTGAAVDLAGVGGNAIVRVGDGTAASAGHSATVNVILTGAARLEKTDLGTLILTSANDYSGGTTVSGGILQIGNGGATGSIVGDVLNNAALVFNRSGTVTFSGDIAGTGSVRKAGNNNMVVAGQWTHDGGTVVDGGALTIGNSSSDGSLSGDVAINNSAILRFLNAAASSFDGNTSGTGAFHKGSDGLLTVTGALAHSGGTQVNQGVLRVDGSVAGLTSVNNGGGLTGTGSLASVTVASGGRLIGEQGQVLTMAGLVLNAGSIVDVSLGAPDTTALFDVTGNLTLDGTLNVTDAGGFGPGLYRLFDYGGALTDNGLDIGSVPGGVDASDLSVQTAVAGQVNLVSGATATGDLLFWDGDAAGNANNDLIDGGDGLWSLTSSNWTGADGAVNGAMTPVPGFAIFAGAAGTVTADNSAGVLSVTGMQFATDGYTLTGSAIDLAGDGDEAIIRVGDGTAAGAGYSATIASNLTGDARLDKADLGTLILSGTNSYTGGTLVSAGTLQIGNGGGSGSIVGDIVNNGTVTFSRSNTVVFGGNISGSGLVRKTNNNSLAIAGDWTHTGGTAIEAGALFVGTGSNIADDGLLTGDVSINIGSSLRFSNLGDTVFGGNTSGAGEFFKLGDSLLTVTGNLAHSGFTTVAGGTLRIGDGTTDGSLAGHAAVMGGAELHFSNVAEATYAGNISSLGRVTKTGQGKLIITGNWTHMGGTVISGSNAVLQIGDGGTSGNITRDITLENGATLIFDRSDDVVYDRAISTPAGNSGTLIKRGDGTLTLTGNNMVSGFHSVQDGVLLVDGSIAGQMSVVDGGALGGTGSLASVSINSGGRLIGRQGQTLGMDYLILRAGSIVDVSLGAPDATPLFDVTGSLELNGTLNVTDAGGFGPGLYRLFDYGGTLTDNGLDIGTVPAGTNAADLAVQTAMAGQVNLVSSVAAGDLLFWDGDAAGNAGNGSVDGGNGVWALNNSNWTNTDGTANGAMTPVPGFAVFAGAAGTVTASDSDGALAVTGMQFASDGYMLVGDPVELAGTGGAAIVRVGDGSAASAGYTATIASNLTGGAQLVKNDAGRLILGGSNGYTGGTRINGGVVQISQDANLGAPAGAIILNGGTLATTASFDSGRDTALLADGRFDVGAGTTFGLDGIVSGSGDLIKQGGGTLRLGGANAYGDTTVEAGTLVGDSGSISGDIANAGTVVFAQTFDDSFAGNIGGHGGTDGLMVKHSNSSILTLTGMSSLDWTVEGGVLVTAAERFSGNAHLTDGGLVFDQAADASSSILLTGYGYFEKEGDGLLILTGANGGFAGHSNVNAGSLRVTGVLGGDLNVNGGGALSGTGSVGDTEVSTGGRLIGAQGQTLTLASLVLESGAIVDVSLGAPAATALFDISGDLTLDGILNVTDAGGFGAGLYRLFDYGGALTDNGLDIGAVPGGVDASDLAIQTAIAGQVNLVNSVAVGDLLFWDGDGIGHGANGLVDGGDGNWSLASSNWTNADGLAQGVMTPVPGFAIFAGAAGTVTADDSAGALSVTGMQFATDGYVLTGAAVDLAGVDGNAVIRIGDGTAAGANMTATIASELTGASTLVKDDLGTLILTGANSYTGDTRINAGTLQIGDGGTSGSIAGDVLNNGMLAFNRSDATAFDGVISGSGVVDVLSGDLTLTGDNSYGGGTGIGGGATLRLGNGGTSGSIVGPVDAAGTLIFDRSDSVDFAGAISGAGTLRQSGSGSTNLTGNSGAFTGTTIVEAGTLAVNGALGGTVDMLAGGRLQGNGTVGEVIVRGTIAPGNSIGTLNVAGNISFAAGSIYEVEANAAGQADRINAAGSATLNGGTVQVLAGAGNYAARTSYTILSADGGVSGTFTGGVTSNLAFLDPSLFYDANNVYLRLTRNDISFAGIGLTPNQIAAGAGAESLGIDTPVFDAVLNLSAEQARGAFDQLSGEIHASSRTTMLEDSRFVRNAVWDRLRGVPAGGKGALWGQGYGSWGHTNGDGNAARLNRSSGGLVMGADGAIGDNLHLGAVWGYGRTEINVPARGSAGQIDSYHLGAYAGGQWGVAAIRTGVAYSWHDVHTTRAIAFPGFNELERATYNGGTFQAFGEVGFGFNLGRTRVEPFANIAYVRAQGDAFEEIGGDAKLTVASASTDVTFSTLGLRMASGFDIGKAGATFRAGAGWRHAFGDRTPVASMRYASGGDAFSIAGLPVTRDAATIDAGLEVAISPNASFGISYGAQFGKGLSDQTGRANLTFRF